MRCDLKIGYLPGRAGSQDRVCKKHRANSALQQKVGGNRMLWPRLDAE